MATTAFWTPERPGSRRRSVPDVFLSQDEFDHIHGALALLWKYYLLPLPSEEDKQYVVDALAVIGRLDREGRVE